MLQPEDKMYDRNRNNDTAILIRFKDSANVTPLVLIAESADKANAWVDTIDGAIEFFDSLDYNKRHILWLWEQFNHADKDNSGVLDNKEILQFFKNINMNIEGDDTRKIQERCRRLYYARQVSAEKKGQTNDKYGLNWTQLKDAVF